jgi:hypothetical protein
MARLGLKPENLHLESLKMEFTLTADEERGFGTKLHLQGNGTVAIISGEDMPETEVVENNQDIIVIKVPGHKFWFQRSLSGGSDNYDYAPAEFRAYLKVSKTTSGWLVRCIGAWSVRKNKS